MSVVTGVTLHTGYGEEERIEKINTWLRSNDFPELKRGIESNYGGSRHPQIHLYGSGYNYFREDEFLVFFKSLDKSWDEPETVVLILNPEEGGARVYRPLGCTLETCEP